jgi:hypothetical protein
MAFGGQASRAARIALGVSLAAISTLYRSLPHRSGRQGGPDQARRSRQGSFKGRFRLGGAEGERPSLSFFTTVLRQNPPTRKANPKQRHAYSTPAMSTSKPFKWTKIPFDILATIFA